MISTDLPAPPAEWHLCWWSPEELLKDARAYIDAIPGHIPGDLLFKKPELKPIKEAWAAAKFAVIRNREHNCQVRLVDPKQQFPDFEINLGGLIERFELTEADNEGRRRGDEYREAAQRAASGLPPGLRHYDPDEEIIAASTAIAIAIKFKSDKHYAESPHLVVYVNFPTDDGRLPLNAFQAAQLAKPYEANFRSIWILWGSNAMRCWPAPVLVQL